MILNLRISISRNQWEIRHFYDSLTHVGQNISQAKIGALQIIQVLSLVAYKLNLKKTTKKTTSLCVRTFSF